MNTSLISLMRDSSLFMRTAASTVIITFGMLILTPTAIAARAQIQKASQQTDVNIGTELSQTFANITEKLEQLEQARETGNEQAINNTIATLKDLQSNIPALDKKTLMYFQQLEQDLIKKKLPEKILQRHRDMVAHYQAHKNALNAKLDNIDKGQWRWKLGKWMTAIQTLITGEKPVDFVDSPYKNLDAKKFKRSQQDFDPNNLPNKSLRPDKDNKPKVKKEAFQQAALFNTPATQLAALGDFTYDKLAGASNPAYLAATDEVLLSQPILDQAALLNYDPVKIYHWVRNNIEWQPTWGAIQDAELTLDAQRGNAMDIASLTIALLRASKIPARYVHGTINVPIEKYNNWAGGFSNSDAAVDFAASAGIPIGAGTSGGKIIEAQLEHVWVEAAIDYFPSRGAKNRDADSWLPMDPSYKQYEYLTGLDAVTISGIDAQQLANDFLASGTINEAEGWISGFDPSILEAAQTQAQTALSDHITNNMSNPTVGDVIGGRKTIIQDYPALASSLPNRIVVEGARYDKLPEQLQQTVTYALGRDEIGRVINPTTFAYSTLNNEKVTLSFKPATADDEAALLALLPEGEITDISQLPQSIPSYLIEVIPELKVNGELRMTGLPMRLGQELVFNTKIRFPGKGRVENYDYNVIAGSYLSVNVVAGNVSSQKLTDLQNNLTATKVKLESNDAAQIASITQEKVLGDIFYIGSLVYFSQLITMTHVGALSKGVHFQLASGYGTFGYEPKVNYMFGFPISISTGSISLDIPISSVTATNDGNAENKKNFVIQAGILSSTLEHAIPELMFNDPDNPTEAISAIKALQKATVQGQKIYQITKANVASVMPLLNLGSGTKQEIVASVNAGLEVTAHTDPVSVPGYTGEGYIIIDSETGSGAYKIAGGGNGSAFVAGVLLGNSFNMAAVLIGPIAATPIGIGMWAIVIGQIIVSMKIILELDPKDYDCVFLGMLTVGVSTSLLAASGAFLIKHAAVIFGAAVTDTLTALAAISSVVDPLSCF